VYASTYNLQDVLNGDAGAGTSGVRITSGLFSAWRGAGITSAEQLFIMSLAFLGFGGVCLDAGWFHHHVAIPSPAWFNDIDAILNHHLTAVIGLGCLAWSGHLVHVAIPTDAFLRLGLGPEGLGVGAMPLTPPMQLVLLNATGVDVFRLDWEGLTPICSNFGGLNPSTGSLWLSDIAHHRHGTCTEPSSTLELVW
jgi:photosystem I P700 chlorophyll a apoprotein A1